MTRRVLLLLTLVSAATAAAAAAVAGGTRHATPADLSALEGIEFVTVCKFSHQSMNDPIVQSPVQPQTSNAKFFRMALPCSVWTTSG